MPFVRTRSTGRVLGFDIENRPLSYLGQEPTADITAIAYAWEDDPSSVKVWLLGIHSTQEILSEFVKVYDEATLVTGHYIRGHDLPIINAHLIEFGMANLKPKQTHDTYLDLKRMKNIPKSQAYWAEFFDVGHKTYVSPFDWREANRLIPSGIIKTKERVISDVQDQLRIRRAMIERNMLKAPKIWHP